jgi:hypothetical protein
MPAPQNYVMTAETGIIGIDNKKPAPKNYTLSVAAGAFSIRPPPINYLMAAA